MFATWLRCNCYSRSYMLAQSGTMVRWNSSLMLLCAATAPGCMYCGGKTCVKCAYIHASCGSSRWFGLLSAEAIACVQLQSVAVPMECVRDP
jgi:hypothetical protein